MRVRLLNKKLGDKCDMNLRAMKQKIRSYKVKESSPKVGHLN